jgi:hypothetical protein
MADRLTGLAAKYDRLARVKTQLAEKYEQQIRITKSKPAKKRLSSRATAFRRQATEAERHRENVLAARNENR